MEDHIVKALHTGISVYNMEQSVAWYEKNLGFRVVKDSGFVPPLKAKIVFMEKNGYEIELFEYEHPIPLPEERKMPNYDLRTVGTKHVAFLTDNMTALRSRFLENGVDIALEVRMDGEAVMFIRDCNGVLIEFIEQ